MKRATFFAGLLSAFSLAGFSLLHAAAAPDLVITDVWVDGTRIHYQVRNVGSLTCPGQHATVLRMDGQYLAKDVIAESIGPGKRLNRSFSKTDFHCTGNAHAIKAIADGDGDIGELREDNNGREESVVCDQVAPGITQGPTVTELGPGRFEIAWKTGEDADSAVLYGQAAGKFTTVSDPALSQDHSISLKNLALGAVYGYQVRSTDPSGNTVQSGLRYFSASAPHDATQPKASEPRKLPADRPLFPLRFEVAAQDDGGVDRVAFSYDGTHFMTDYDPPFRAYLLPGELGLTHASYFGLDHAVLAEVYDLSDNLRTTTAAWAERPRCAEMELEIELGASTRIYTPEEAIYAYAGEIRILARKNAGLLLGPGEGPHPGPTGTRWEAVDEVRVYYDGSLIQTLAPGAGETDLDCPLDIAALAAPSTHEIQVEVQTGACVMRRRATLEVIRQMPEVTAERTVTRDGTGFDVAVTFVNSGTTPAIMDHLVEEAEGFQITVPESSLYDATVTYDPGTRRSLVAYAFHCQINSGSSRTFRYTAIPILSEGVSGYLLGENNASAFHDAFDRRFSANTLPRVSRVGDRLVADAVDDACRESDYLIVTNPAGLFGIHEPEAVNRLLSKTAELADVRRAILGYYLGAGSVRTAYRSDDKIACGNVLNDWKDEIVILDASDDVVRMYSPNREHFIGPGDDRDLPIPVPGLHADDVLLVGNLLTDADPSHPEDEIAIVDGHSSGGARGNVVLYDYRPDHDDFVQDTNDTTYDPSNGDRIIAGDMIHQAAAPDSDEIILFDGPSGEVRAYYGNGPVHRRWASVYEPGDLVAAGDLIASIDGDEIVVGDVSAQRIHVYSGDGAIQHHYACSLERSDRLQISREGLALASNGEDRVSIRGIDVGRDWAVGSFDVNVHSSDVFFRGHVIEHGSPQYLFARGHRENNFTPGDVEIFPYSGLAGGEPGDRQHLDSLLSPGGEWAEKMGADFVDGGYLLIVGETEIIPACATSFYLSGKGRQYVQYTDNHYANTSGEMKKPEISAGRIIGNTIDALMIPIQTSLDVASGDAELNLAEAYCFSGGPEERHETARHTVVEALEDKGWHVVRNDEPSADTVYSHTENIDALYMAGHGNWDHCWTVDRDNVESRFDPGRTAPIVFAASCLTGQYPASVDTLGEHFLEKGASAYIGATEVSYSPYNRYLSEGFFSRLEFDSPIGAALKGAKRNRMGDGGYGKYQSAIYHFYGDPRLEAIGPGGMAESAAAGQAAAGPGEKAVQGPVDTVNVSIPRIGVARAVGGQGGDGRPGVFPATARFDRVNAQEVQQAGGKDGLAGRSGLNRLDSPPGGENGGRHAGHAGPHDHQVAGDRRQVAGHGAVSRPDPVSSSRFRKPQCRASRSSAWTRAVPHRRGCCPRQRSLRNSRRLERPWPSRYSPQS